MIEQAEITHHIQKHILGVLLHQRTARFRDMRAPRVDTNLYSYHLTQLVKSGLVKKVDGGYSLDTKGLAYVDRLNADKLFVRPQPKIVTMAVIQNGFGDVLMYQKWRQPFIERWTLPFGKVHNDDESISIAAQREVNEKVGAIDVTLRHAGDAYIRVHDSNATIITMLAHVFHGEVADFTPANHLQWIKLRDLESYDTAPAIKEIVARTLFRDPFFFEEYDADLVK
jgi:8-oxo-dGTP pyrophosphatase MutT (NUDIX family)